MSRFELHAAHLTGWPLLQEEEGDIGNVDLLTLNEDESCLQVNPKWLQHLQVTHLVCHTAASKQSRIADTFSLLFEETLPAGQSKLDLSGCSTSR